MVIRFENQSEINIWCKENDIDKSEIIIGSDNEIKVGIDYRWVNESYHGGRGFYLELI